MNPSHGRKFAPGSQMDPNAEVFEPGTVREGDMASKNNVGFHLEAARGNSREATGNSAIGNKEKGHGYENQNGISKTLPPMAGNSGVDRLCVHENNMGSQVGLYSMDKGPLRVMNPDPSSPKEKQSSAEPESANPQDNPNHSGQDNRISGSATPVESRNEYGSQVEELRAIAHQELPEQPEYPVWNQPPVHATFPLLPYYHNQPGVPGGMYPHASPVPQHPDNPYGRSPEHPAYHQPPMGTQVYGAGTRNNILIHQYVPVEFRRRMRTSSGEMTRPFRHFGSNHMEVAGLYPVARAFPTGPAPLPMGRGNQHRAGVNHQMGNPDPVTANWNEYRNQRVRDWLSDIGD